MKYTVEYHPNFIIMEFEAGSQDEAIEMMKENIAEYNTLYEMIEDAEYYVKEIE
jgi:hypothetical protein